MFLNGTKVDCVTLRKKKHNIPKPHILGSLNQGYITTDAPTFRFEIGREGMKTYWVCAKHVEPFFPQNNAKQKMTHKAFAL